MKVVSKVISTATTGSSKFDVICTSVESYWEDLEDLVEDIEKAKLDRETMWNDGIATREKCNLW